MKNSKETPKQHYPVKTSQGLFQITVDSEGHLKHLVFPSFSAKSKKTNRISLPKNSGSVFKMERSLNRYFSGKKIDQKPQLSHLPGTTFQKKVWKALLRIPYGHTRTYKWLAQQVGSPKAVRAVGSACGKNPLPLLIPCHRVVTSSGTLGGFSSGLKWKEFLLALEKGQNHGKIKKEKRCL